MASESFCRPVVNSTKKIYLGIGVVVGTLLTLALAWFMGWLTR